MTNEEFQKLLGDLAEAEQKHDECCQEYHEEHDDSSRRRMLSAYRIVSTLQAQVDAELEAEKRGES